MASGGEDIDGNSPGNDRGPVASIFYGHAQGPLTNLDSFTFGFLEAQNASYPLTDSSFQTPLSHNGSTDLLSNFWNQGQPIVSVQNETGLSLMNAGQPLLLDTTVSPSFNGRDYTSSSGPGRNQFLTPDTTANLTGGYFNPLPRSNFTEQSYVEPTMTQQYSTPFRQDSPWKSNPPLENDGMPPNIPKTPLLIDSSPRPVMNPRKRKRLNGLDGKEHLDRPAKLPKMATSEEALSTQFPEKAVAELFRVWQSTKPKGALPSEVVVHGFAMVTGLSYQQIHDWYFTKQHPHPVPDDAHIHSSISTSEIATDSVDVVLRRAATRLPARRDQCLKGISPEEMTANRSKAWNSDEMFSCTSCCGKTFNRKSDWDRHEKINRPQRAWLCNHGSTWKNRCSFCHARRPGPNHIEQAHNGRMLCCDKSLSLGSGKDSRIFLRKSGLKQHFDNTHPYIPFDEFGEEWSFTTLQAFHERCGFCGEQLITWDNRSEHVSDHFKDDKMRMDQWQDPWEGPPVAPRENAEDKDSDIDSDDPDRDDGADESDDSSDGGSDDRHDGLARNDADRNFESPEYEAFPPPQDLDHDLGPQDSGQWSMYGSVSKIMFQLGLYFRSILGEGSVSKSRLPSFLSFRDLAKVIRHWSLYSTGPLSLAKEFSKAPREEASTLSRGRALDTKCSLPTILQPPSNENLVMTFWLRPLSRDFAFEALSSRSIHRRGLLGMGSSGCVDEIRIPNHDQALARKSCRHPSFLQRRNILQELSLLSRVDHHHVVRGLGVMLESATSSLLMAPVADYTLRDLLKMDKIGLLQAVALKQSLGCLASALDAIHHQDIRHGDLKPANILVVGNFNGPYRMLIADFGLSTHSSNFTSRSPNSRGLTPLYAAPELYTNETPKRAADVYSMGLVFFEILTVLAGRTIGELHDFMFADPPNLPNRSDKAYWRRSDRINDALSLYRQTIEQKIKPDTRWFDIGQLEILVSMLDLSAPLRPQASETMRNFPPRRCCGGESTSIFSRRCQQCLKLESGLFNIPFVTTHDILLDSASLEGCHLCSFLANSLLAILPDDLLFCGELLWNGDDWRFLSPTQDKQKLIEFFTLPSHSIGLQFPGLRKGQLTSGNTSSTDALLLARQWLDECVSTHEPCRASQIPVLPERVLDLSHDRVRLSDSKGTRGLYVALSYCWGAGEHLKTTTSTLASHSEGIAWTTIPRTFQDAIIITRQLGVEYLWIDALCIIQDCQEDWVRQSGMMYDIYSNAQCTIAAVSSKSMSSGVFSTDKTGHFATTIEPYDVCARQQIPHTSRPLFGIPDHAPSNAFPLMTRAWTLQEQLLSPRVLHFGAQEVSWACKVLETCECSAPQNTISIKRQDDERSYYPAWHDIISEYSHRTLSYPQDILVAISGVAKLFQKLNGDEYCAGLWQTTLQEDMLWSCSEPSPSRPHMYRAPTWSWASIDAHVGFGVAPQVPRLVIRDVQCLSDGVFGEVLSGSLTLSAPIIPATLYYSSKRKTQRCQYELEFANGLKRQTFRADYILSKHGTHHISSGTSVSVLVVGEIEDSVTLTCLVLRQLPSGKFERLGLVLLDVSSRISRSFDDFHTLTIV